MVSGIRRPVTPVEALMKRILVLLVAGFALCGSKAMATGVTCTTADYRGTYAFFSYGYLLQLPPAGAPLLGQFAQSGTFTSDGEGNINIESQASYNGLILNAPAQGTYTVSPDCLVTYNIVLPLPLGAPSTFTGILSSNNREQTVTITDPPGTMVMGRHLKQDMSFCSTSDFTGSYKIDIDGSVAAPPSRAGKFFEMGRLVSDGKGKFTGAIINNFNGTQTKQDISGTYTLNSRCYLTLQYPLGSENIVIAGPLAGHGEAGMLMIMSPGWTVSGTIKAQ
jgi:hypothetical protein